MNEAQREELSALEAVFPEELSVVSKLHYTYSMQLEESGHSLTLYFEFHSDYPVVMPPRFQLESFGLDEKVKAELRNELLALFEADSGVLFVWVDHIKHFLAGLPSVSLHDTESVQPKLSDKQPQLVVESQPGSPTTPPIPGDYYELKIFHGEPVTDRKSVFQAHVCQVCSLEQVRQMLSELKSNKKIAQATHNILAYRFIDKDKAVLMQDCDDDKEHGAGGKLSHLLQYSGAEGVAVVVTRWYGGIQLGPDRFKHINNVARTLLVDCGLVQGAAEKGSKKKKR